MSCRCSRDLSAHACLRADGSELRRDQSCVKSGRFRRCSAIQFCRLWMENNNAMIRQLVIKLHFFLENKGLYSCGKAGSLPRGGSQPTLQHQDLQPPWGWDMLGHPINTPSTPYWYIPGLQNTFEWKVHFSGHPSSVCFGTRALFVHPLVLMTSLVVAGLGWHSLQGPGWGELQKVCGGGSTEHHLF